MRCCLLYIVGQLRAGGLERQLCFLLEGMDRRRYQPEVLVWNYEEDDPYVSRIRALGVPLHYFPRGFSGISKLRALRPLVMKINPEVIHSYSFYTNFAAWWATLGTNIVAIGAVQSAFDFDKKAAGPLIGRLSARWPRAQIFNNYGAAKTVECVKSFFVPQRVSVVRNGLDLEYFRFVPLSGSSQVCITGVGSLHEVKRWDRLVGAAQKLKQQGYQFLIQIVGDGPLYGALIQQVRELAVDDCVKISSYCDDVPSLLANSTFIVHPSDSEGCPNVVMEAMACGRAVIATNVGDVDSLIEEGVTGFVVPAEDNVQLVQRMETLITDRNLCRRMGIAGRAKAEAEFGFTRLVDQTLDFYRNVGWVET